MLKIMKTVILCEAHDDILNRYTQQKIAEFLKTLGYQNFFLESHTAGALAENKYKGNDPAIKACRDIVGKVFNNPDFDQSPLFQDACPTINLLVNESYDYPNYWMIAKVITGYNLFGFDMDNDSRDLTRFLSAAEKAKICLDVFANNKNNHNKFALEFIDCIRNQARTENFYDALSVALVAGLDENSNTKKIEVVEKLINSLEVYTFTTALETYVNRDAMIVKNVLRLAAEHKGNIFHMGGAHCYDILQSIGAGAARDDFFFVLPLWQYYSLGMLRSIGEEPETSFVNRLNFTLPLKNAVVTKDPPLINSAVFDAFLTHSDQFIMESPFDLYCSLADYQDVEACFNQFVAEFT